MPTAELIITEEDVREAVVWWLKKEHGITIKEKDLEVRSSKNMRGNDFFDGYTADVLSRVVDPEPVAIAAPAPAAPVNF